LSKAYQNPALTEYFEVREDVLIRKTFDLFLQNKIEDARGLAGQVYELRTLRNTLRVCYTFKREDRSSLKKDRHSRGQTRNRISYNATAQAPALEDDEV
jgi:hypothetical protein